MGITLDDTSFPTRLPCFNDGSCPVNDTMLQFLNITTKSEYFQVYCLNPPADSCPFDFCPNPDISGPAIRVSTYITSICLAMLILYSDEKNGILAAFYSQLLTVYSFMLTATISIRNGNLTRLHATFAQYSVASPLSLYILIYAIRSVFARKKNKNHRMAEVFGKGQVVNRALVIAMFPFWITLTVFIALPSQRHRFSQLACDWRSSQAGLGFFYYNPFSIASEWWKVVASVSPLVILILFWTIGIWLQRKIIWKHDRTRKLPLARMWSKVNHRYPFIRFYTVILLPFTIWCLTLELGTRPADEVFQVSFGQILPLFVAIPPILSCLALIPYIGPWFTSLTWFRFITRRPPNPQRPGHMARDSSAVSGVTMSTLDSSSSRPLLSQQSTMPSSMGYKQGHGQTPSDETYKTVGLSDPPPSSEFPLRVLSMNGGVGDPDVRAPLPSAAIGGGGADSYFPVGSPKQSAEGQV